MLRRQNEPAIERGEASEAGRRRSESSATAAPTVDLSTFRRYSMSWDDDELWNGVKNLAMSTDEPNETASNSRGTPHTSHRTAAPKLRQPIDQNTGLG